MDIDQVRQLAHLSRLNLSDEELAQYTQDFTSILGYVDELQSLDISDVAETAQHRNINVFREDTDPIDPGTHTDDIVAGMPQSHNNYLVVPKVLNQS